MQVYLCSGELDYTVNKVNKQVNKNYNLQKNSDHEKRMVLWLTH